MLKKIIIVVALISLVCAAPKWHQLENYSFDQYMRDFQKNYIKGSEEFIKRQSIFQQKLSQIISHNKNNFSWKKGVNSWTDHTVEEFKMFSLGLDKSMKFSYNQIKYKNYFEKTQINEISPEEMADLPQSVDWRNANIVSPVKDQGHCGSCWAFASVATIESHAALNSGKLKMLSTEQLVECMPNNLQCGGTGGCYGAIPELVFNYVQLSGLTSEFKYPYTSYFGNSDQCHYNNTKQTPEVTLDGYYKLPENNYTHLLKAVATVGPIAVNVFATNWHDYEEGIYDGCDYNSNIDINHVVVLVGYGSDQNGDYWLVRNSWGTRWGENGYIRLRREAELVCGIDSSPLDGVKCQGQNYPYKVCGQCGILSDTSFPINARVIG